MDRLLGGVPPSGSRLDPNHFWQAAESLCAASPAVLAVDRSTQRASVLARGQQAPQDCALLLSSGEWQRQESEGVWVRLQGHLDNLAQLARESGAEREEGGAEWPVQVLRRCYQLWGPSCFARFRGSFACVILDLRRQKLLLARDHVGSKSLYLSTDTSGDGFYFASTIGALLAIRGVPARANFSVLRNWLLDLPDDDPAQTFFEGITQLPAASVLELDLNSSVTPSVTPFWAIPEENPCSMERAAAEARLRTLLRDSLAQAMGETDSVGVALSGGIDSSVVLAALKDRTGGSSPIQCFTSVTETASSRAEEARAQAAAEACGASMHRVPYDWRGIPAEIDSVVKSVEEPVASPVPFAHRALYRAAQSAGVQVLLNGHGADSLFAGSNSHLVSLAASALRQGRPLRAYGLLAHAPRRMRHFRSLVTTLLPPEIRAALHRERAPAWLEAEWFRAKVSPSAEGVEHSASGRLVPLRLQRIRELQSISLPHVLRFEERAGEAHRIDGRSPFLAPELIEFAFSLPDTYLISKDGLTKSILRSAFAETLPDAIRTNRERTGFPVPAANWLRQLRDWSAEEVANAERLPFIRTHSASGLWQQLQGTESPNPRGAMDLWRMIFLARWAKIFGVQF